MIQRPEDCEDCRGSGVVPDYGDIPEEYMGDVDVGSLPLAYCWCATGDELLESDRALGHAYALGEGP